MAIKQVPVIDAAEATQQISYDDRGGGLIQLVQLSSPVSVGGKAYTFDGSMTLYGSAADRPSAAAAHSFRPFVFYVAPGAVVSQTDGAEWVEV